MAHTILVESLREGIQEGRPQSVEQPFSWCPKDHINTRILETMISDSPLMLGLGTRMSESSVSLVFWPPILTGTGRRPLPPEGPQVPKYMVFRSRGLKAT